MSSVPAPHSVVTPSKMNLFWLFTSISAFEYIEVGSHAGLISKLSLSGASMPSFMITLGKDV